MATPGELVKAVADVLGIPEATVVVHDRNLVTAGLRTKGGRGRSAAVMTAHDAATLIIAIVGSSAVKDTVAAWNDYSTLPAKTCEARSKDGRRYDQSPRWLLPGLLLDGIRNLGEGHTFLEALTEIIRAAADGSLKSAIDAISPDMKGSYTIPKRFRIEVTLFGPYPQASIRISATPPGIFETINYTAMPTNAHEIEEMQGELQTKYTGDLNQVRYFSQRTIFAIGTVIATSTEHLR